MVSRTSLLIAFALLAAGCGSRSATVATNPDPLAHKGSIGGYHYEMSGDPMLRTEQIPDEKGVDYPKVTCGTNWFSVRNKNLYSNGLDYGTVVKPGDTIKVAADGKLFVNGEFIAALPKVPPSPPNIPENDLNKE